MVVMRTMMTMPFYYPKNIKKRRDYLILEQQRQQQQQEQIITCQDSKQPLRDIQHLVLLNNNISTTTNTAYIFYGHRHPKDNVTLWHKLHEKSKKMFCAQLLYKKSRRLKTSSLSSTEQLQEENTGGKIKNLTRIRKSLINYIQQMSVELYKFIIAFLSFTGRELFLNGMPCTCRFKCGNRLSQKNDRIGELKAATVLVKTLISLFDLTKEKHEALRAAILTSLAATEGRVNCEMMEGDEDGCMVIHIVLRGYEERGSGDEEKEKKKKKKKKEKKMARGELK
eukprot:jgi/Bigna1/141615/aug1.64_g16323